jgi:hypothetical protein
MRMRPMRMTRTVRADAGVIHIKRKGFITNSSAGFGGDWSFALTAALGTVSSSDIIGMFDLYRINAFVAEFRMNPNLNSGTNTSLPRMDYTIDKNDASAPTTVDQIFAYNNHRTFQWGPSSHTCAVKVYPKLLNRVTVEPGILTTVSENTGKNPWLPTDTATNATHYGLKGIITNLAPSSVGTIGVWMTIYFSLKRPR